MNIVKLLAYVKAKHSTQKRKYTGEPYFMHLMNVATMADDYTPFGFEIGLLHDILEDYEYTGVDYIQLAAALNSFGCQVDNLNYILSGVVALTDEYTHERYPKLNRQQRKIMEAERLYKIDPAFQTIKYCDLIDNTSSIVQHDPGFAVKYLEEKEYILQGMTAGDPVWLARCQETLLEAQKHLSTLQS